MSIICILGLPASGKTTFAEELLKTNPDHIIVHTDLFSNSVNKLQNMIVMSSIIYKKDLIVEGILCYDLLLKKDIEKYITKVYYLDVQITEIISRYNESRKNKNTDVILSFCKKLNKIFEKINQSKFNWETI